jgi:hypothetical protein
LRFSKLSLISCLLLFFLCLPAWGSKNFIATGFCEEYFSKKNIKTLKIGAPHFEGFSPRTTKAIILKGRPDLGSGRIFYVDYATPRIYYLLNGLQSNYDVLNQPFLAQFGLGYQYVRVPGMTGHMQNGFKLKVPDVDQLNMISAAVGEANPEYELGLKFVPVYDMSDVTLEVKYSEHLAKKEIPLMSFSEADYKKFASGSKENSEEEKRIAEIIEFYRKRTIDVPFWLTLPRPVSQGILLKHAFLQEVRKLAIQDGNKTLASEIEKAIIDEVEAFYPAMIGVRAELGQTYNFSQAIQKLKAAPSLIAHLEQWGSTTGNEFHEPHHYRTDFDLTLLAKLQVVSRKLEFNGSDRKRWFSSTEYSKIYVCDLYCNFKKSGSEYYCLTTRNNRN